MVRKRKKSLVLSGPSGFLVGFGLEGEVFHGNFELIPADFSISVQINLLEHLLSDFRVSVPEGYL